MSDTVRTWTAWIVAIATFSAVNLFASIVGDKIGVPTIIDVDPYTVSYGRGVEIDQDSITTAYGWGILVLSALVATIVWYRIQGKQLSATAQVQSYGFLLGGALMTILGVPLWLVFHRTSGLAGVIGNIFELALFAGSIFAGIRLTKHLEHKRRSARP